MRFLLFIPPDPIVGWSVGWVMQLPLEEDEFPVDHGWADGSLMRCDFCLLACVLLGWAIRDGYHIIRYSDRML